MPSSKRSRSGRDVILVKDLDDETLGAVMEAEPSEESKRLGYPMDDPET